MDVRSCFMKSYWLNAACTVGTGIPQCTQCMTNDLTYSTVVSMITMGSWISNMGHAAFEFCTHAVTFPFESWRSRFKCVFHEPRGCIFGLCNVEVVSGYVKLTL